MVTKLSSSAPISTVMTISAGRNADLAEAADALRDRHRDAFERQRPGEDRRRRRW